VPLYATRISRLLVEMNRTVAHRDLFSPFSRALPVAERETLLSRYYWPHWKAIAGEIARITEGGGVVLHLAIHTFTPVLDGEVRDVEMGILYDPGRGEEKSFARQWRSHLRRVLPEATSGIRIRFNRPYRGTSDGLSTWLRKRFSAESYLGVEVEVSQGVIQGGGRRWATLRSAILTTLVERLPRAPRYR
jgi:predicted N-formylglutamate amidohydrolase